MHSKINPVILILGLYNIVICIGFVSNRCRRLVETPQNRQSYPPPPPNGNRRNPNSRPPPPPYGAPHQRGGPPPQRGGPPPHMGGPPPPNYADYGPQGQTFNNQSYNGNQQGYTGNPGYNGRPMGKHCYLYNYWVHRLN